MILSVDETVRNPKSEDPQVSNLFLPALAREWELKTVGCLCAATGYAGTRSDARARNEIGCPLIKSD